MMDIDFDPELWMTWPIPDQGVNTRRENGTPRRLSVWGDGWLEGFEKGLRMAHAFNVTGEWDVTA